MPTRVYKNYIRSLPIDETTVIAMHKNANITFAQKETYTLFDILLSLMAKASKSAGGKTRGEIRTELALALWKCVHKVFPFSVVSRRNPIESKESMSSVPIQEVIRYNRLLNTIHSTLALMGALETMCSAIFLNQVPGIWDAKAYLVAQDNIVVGGRNHRVAS
ncbi:hypothetical protein HK405_005005 [Cladochytrium tenue]|nr:hypothetical protein HK405_005005 [Cladochytrium tenue]